MAKANPFAGKQAAPFQKGGAKGKAPPKKGKGNPFAGKESPAEEKAEGFPAFKKGGAVKKK